MLKYLHIFTHIGIVNSAQYLSVLVNYGEIWLLFSDEEVKIAHKSMKVLISWTKSQLN